MDKFLNILRIIGAAILSVLLFGVLLITPIISASSSFIQKDAIQEVMKNIDYVEFLESNEELLKNLEDNNIPKDVIVDLLNSETIEEFIDLYIADVFDGLNGDMNIDFDSEQLAEIANTHMDELLPIFKNAIPEEFIAQVDEELLKQEIVNAMSGLSTQLPSVQDIFSEQVDEQTKQVIEILKVLNTGSIVIPFVIVAIVLSLLILACRWNKFEGFIWLAVVFVSCAGLSFVIGSGFSGVDATMLDVPAELIPVILSALAVFGSKIKTTSLILGLCAVIFMGIFIYTHRNKKQEVVEVENI